MTTLSQRDTITLKEMISMLWIWVAAIVAFIIIEAATVQLVTVWFAVGAVGGLITCLLKLPLYVQIITFVVISALALIITKPLVKRITKTQKQPTNADRLIGKQAVVTEPIDNVLGKGAAQINGLEWTARSSDGSNIEKDTVVTVEAIEGAKLIVK